MYGDAFDVWLSRTLLCYYNKCIELWVNIGHVEQMRAEQFYVDYVQN
jgi:hypothetical protein